jgi:hypothetical protein
MDNLALSGSWTQARRIAIPAVVLAKGGVRAKVSVTNLSREGCLVNSSAMSLRDGQDISLRIEGLESLPARVQWMSGTTASIAFEWPLYEPVANHLVARFAL